MLLMKVNIHLQDLYWELKLVLWLGFKESSQYTPNGSARDIGCDFLHAIPIT